MVFVSYHKLWAFWSSRDHKSMNVESIIKKLQTITKQNVVEWAQMETRGGSKIVEKKRSGRRVAKNRTWKNVDTTTKGVPIHQVISLDFEWIHWL
jgi:hypothetical protein